MTAGRNTSGVVFAGRLSTFVLSLGGTALAFGAVWWPRVWFPDGLILFGWVATGVTLVRGDHVHDARRAARWPLAITCALEAARLPEFIGWPAFPTADLTIEMEATRRLFDLDRDPYAAPESGWFPFPAFWLLRILSFGGTLDDSKTAMLFLALNVASFIAVACCLARIGPSAPGVEAPRWLVALAVLLHPSIVQAILIGQTAVFVAALLCVGMLAWGRGAVGPWLAGLAFTLAWMLKPHLLVLGLYFVLCAARDRLGSRRMLSISEEGAIGLRIVAWSVAIVATLMFVPGGITSDTFAQFLVVAHRHRVWSEDWSANYSPVAIALHVGAQYLGIVYQDWLITGMTFAMLVTVAVGIAAAGAGARGVDAAHAWTVASLLPFAGVWRHYYAWATLAVYALTLAAWRPGMPASVRLAIFTSIGMTHMLASPLFTVGLVTLFLTAHASACYVAASSHTGCITSPGVRAGAPIDAAPRL